MQTPGKIKKVHSFMNGLIVYLSIISLIQKLLMMLILILLTIGNIGGGTDIELTEENIEDIVRGGRTR